MFNDVNLANRLRYPVRGRVIVFTDSPSVEYVNEPLTMGYPLFSSPAAYPAGSGLLFVIEAKGWLTFDAGAQVKITEMDLYERFCFDPRASSVVTPADIPSDGSGSGPAPTPINPPPPVRTDLYVTSAEKGEEEPGWYTVMLILGFSDGRTVHVGDYRNDRNAPVSVLLGLTPSQLVELGVPGLADRGFFDNPNI